MIEDHALDTIFRTARTHYAWSQEPVSDAELQALYDLLKLGPTSANSSPARFAFLRTREARDRLSPALSPGNLKALAAPVIVVVATDPAFFDKLPLLFPHEDARSWFAGNTALAEETAFRNATLQGAYLIVAARALGLDCGPMSGFDTASVDSIFFSQSGWRSNFLVALGHGAGEPPHPRAPRLEFDQACVML